MAIKKIRMRPEGTNDYADVLYPETNVNNVLMPDGVKLLAAKLTEMDTAHDEHKAEIVSQDERGHISFSDMPGLWQKIDEVKVSVDTLQVDVNINILKNYKELLVVLDTIGTEVTPQARGLKLNFNDSLTGYYKNGSGSGEKYTPLTGMLSNHTYTSVNELIPHHAEILISNGDNAKVGYGLFSGANSYSGLSFIWNSSNPINKISIVSDSATSKIKSGSIIKVWGR